MRSLSAILLTLLALGASTNSHSYTLNQFINTSHYSINEVILDRGEAFDVKTQEKITKDIETLAQGQNYQTVTAVFPAGSKGLKGTINQKLAGLLTISKYTQGPASVRVVTDNVYATDVGITLDKDLLLTFVNNRVMTPLFEELKQLPLILADMEVEQNSKDYKGTRYYTFKQRGYVIDAAIIDSVFYDEDKRENVKPGCKVTLMALVDRLSSDAPMYMAIHGAVNSIKCDQKGAKNK